MLANLYIETFIYQYETYMSTESVYMNFESLEVARECCHLSVTGFAIKNHRKTPSVLRPTIRTLKLKSGIPITSNWKCTKGEL